MVKKKVPPHPTLQGEVAEEVVKLVEQLVQLNSNRFTPLQRGNLNGFIYRDIFSTTVQFEEGNRLVECRIHQNGLCEIPVNIGDLASELTEILGSFVEPTAIAS